MIRIALLSATALVAVSASAQAKCFVTTASGVGLSKEIATPLSQTALATAISMRDVEGKGKVSTKCEGAFPVVTCKSSQRTCEKKK
jgi:hypothetical protein